jgi:uncharacterized protein (UPF0262 family)
MTVQHGERTMRRVLLSEQLRARGAPERWHEWELAARELEQRNVFRLANAGAASPGPSPALRVALDAEALLLEVVAEGDELLVLARVPIPPMRRLIADYLLLMEQMEQLEEGFGSPRMDTLDMAKKVYHDEAATMIQRCLRGQLDPDMETARRLFTLLLVLLHDTRATTVRSRELG